MENKLFGIRKIGWYLGQGIKFLVIVNLDSKREEFAKYSYIESESKYVPEHILGKPSFPGERFLKKQKMC